MTTNVTLWQPSKAAADYTDEEVLQTPVFARLSEATGLPAKDNLPFARGAIDEMWRKQRQSRFAGPIAALYSLFDAAKEVGDSFIVNRDGSFKPLKKTAASASEGGRMKNPDYAHFIGQGNTPLHPKARHGGFIIEVTQARTPARNGVFELVIGPGITGNKVCDVMTAKLYQYPANGAKMPVISYPPVKGERADHRKGISLLRNDDVVEVAAMSGMMKASVLAQPQTPAELFGLRKLLKAAPVASAVPAAIEDEDEDEDEANANAILDGDKEYGSDD